MRKAKDARQRKAARAKWIAAGFLGAFATSVFTVIYTGLNVEGSRAEFDSGFRSVTIAMGEAQTVDLVFESDAEYADARLEVTLPEPVRFAGQKYTDRAPTPVAIVIGRNTIPVEIEAVAPGSGYLSARLEADEPIGIYRVFVTVTPD